MKNVNEILNSMSLATENDEMILKEMKKAFLNCPQAVAYVKKLGIPDETIDEEIIKINDFVKDCKYCTNCPGVENCKKDNALTITELRYEHGRVMRELRPCKKIYEKARLENQFAVSDFDHVWFTKNLQSINKTAQRQQALAKFINFSNDISDKWIYMTGTMNSGRTYMAAIMAIESVKNNRGPACFINASSRLSELYSLSFKDKDKYERLLDIYMTVPVLVIDDFGSELKNDFVRNIVMQILIKRSGKRLFTIFTSDYDISEIVELYSQSKIASIEAKRIGNILKSECEKEINLGGLAVY